LVGLFDALHRRQANGPHSAATNVQSGESVAIKKVTNVFSKKILAKRALREIKLLQHFRGHRNVR
jgi:mitogen-activated protein kinase 7